MGAFYGSIHVRTENADTVRKVLDQVANEAGCKFLLGPALNGWTSVFPEDSGQSDRISLEIAKQLPDDVLHLVVHDDDIFAYYFYRGGRLIDRYNSCPDYFGDVSDGEKQQSQGHPELFRELLREPKSLSRLETLLAADKEKYTFESERMAKFIELLGLSNALSSYEYLQEGERDEIEGWEQFIHIESPGDGKRPGAGDVKQPDPAESFNLLGHVKRLQGDLDGALADFNKAVELKPDFAAAWNNRGLAKQTKGDWAGALADFSRAIEIKPELAAAYNNRGEVRRAKGDFNDALADFNKAIELKPDLPEAYNNRAQVKRARGDLDGSVVDFSKAIELKPDGAQIYNNRGEAKRAGGDINGALADYNKAIELKPDLAAAWNNRGVAKQVKGDLDGALSDCSRAIELKPDMAAAYTNRGLAKHRKGDFAGAVVDHDKAIELKPGVPQFHKNRADGKRAKGDLEGALVDYNRTLELKSDWAEAYNDRGEVKRGKSDLEGAVADYNKAIELKPTLAAAYNNRGLVKRFKKDLEGALADFDKALELNPRSAQAYCNRGLIKRARGELESALADYDKAIELKSDLAEAYLSRGSVKQTKGDSAGAHADYHKAMELDVDSVGADVRRFIKKPAKRKLNDAGASDARPDRKTIPTTENTLVLRTDFSDEAAWESLCAAIQEPDEEFGFTANVDFISDPEYDGLTVEKLPSLFQEDPPQSFAFIIDHISLTHPDHPILVVDLQNEPCRTFRVIPKEMWNVENNLSIANMDFDEFADAVDPEGVFRGFQK